MVQILTQRETGLVSRCVPLLMVMNVPHNMQLEAFYTKSIQQNRKIHPGFNLINDLFIFSFHTIILSLSPVKREGEIKTVIHKTRLVSLSVCFGIVRDSIEMTLTSL